MSSLDAGAPAFYAELPGFRDFSGVSDDKNYRRVPREWVVLVSDIVDSTKAIEAGRYKDVNLLGAAAIASAQNTMGGLDFPYLFGGDGATLLIPAEYLGVVRQSLANLRDLARRSFDLTLRVGAVPVDAVMRAGYDLEIAKYEIVPGRFVACLRGGGTSWATEQVKQHPERHEIHEQPEGDANLNGLSCRWQPIPSRRGVVLSILIELRGKRSSQEYRRITDELTRIFGGDLETANPVRQHHLSYKSFRQSLADEVRYRPMRRPLLFLSTVAELLVAGLAFRTPLGRIVPPTRRYRDQLATHADYRKMDDVLQMVMDCTAEEARQIEETLADFHAQGRIFYGTFASDTSLMTCYLQSLADGDHVHFVDGGGGGYALAAKQLKEQRIAAR